MNCKLPLFLSVALFISASARITAAPLSFSEEVRRHIIVIDHKGEPLSAEITKSDKGGKSKYKVGFTKLKRTPKNPNDPKNYRLYIQNILDHIAESKTNKIMFFIHGGMNFTSGAVVRAAELLDKGDIARKGYYPIFICWDSNPFTTYLEHLFWVRAGKTEKYGRSHAYSLITSPLYLFGDFGRAITRMPAEISALASSDTYAMHPDSFTEYQLMQEEYAYLQGGSNGEKPPGEIAVSQGPNRRTATSEVVRGASLVLSAPFKLATEPIIDGIGVGAWDNMLRRTDTMFDATPTRKDYRRPVQERLKYSPTGALSIFMTGLTEAKRDYKLTIVGHSMGTIIANRMIRDYNELDYQNIIYMAAACRVFDYESSVIAYLKNPEHSGTKFYNLSLHPKCEAGEVYHMGTMPLDVPPRGSLLVWIDTIFGNPQSEERRMLGIFQTALIESSRIPSDIRKQIVYKAFDADCPETPADKAAGIVRHPQKHGDFSNSPFWEEDFWQPHPGDLRAPIR